MSDTFIRSDDRRTTYCFVGIKTKGSYNYYEAPQQLCLRKTVPEITGSRWYYKEQRANSSQIRRLGNQFVHLTV